MKINSLILADFFNDISMNELTEVLIDFRDNGVYVIETNETNTNSCYAMLPKEKFTDYVALGKCVTTNIKKIAKYSKNFKNDVEIIVKGNLMIFESDKRDLAFELKDYRFYDEKKSMQLIQTTNDINTIKHDYMFEVSQTELKQFLSDTSDDNDKCIIIETHNDTIYIKNDDTFKFTYKIDVPGVAEGVTCKFRKPFFDTVTKLKKGNIKFNIGNDMPILVDFTTVNYNIKFLVAPVIENE